MANFEITNDLILWGLEGAKSTVKGFIKSFSDVELATSATGASAVLTLRKFDIGNTQNSRAYKIYTGSFPIGSFSANKNITITFPEPFNSDTNYSLVFSPVTPRSTAVHAREDNASAKTSTGFTFYANTQIGVTHYDWIAIGY